MTKATPHPANPDPCDDKLDEEEQEILSACEAGKTTRVADTVTLLARHREYAEAAFRKDAPEYPHLVQRPARLATTRLGRWHPFSDFGGKCFAQVC